MASSDGPCGLRTSDVCLAFGTSVAGIWEGGIEEGRIWEITGDWGMAVIWAGLRVGCGMRCLDVDG